MGGLAVEATGQIEQTINAHLQGKMNKQELDKALRRLGGGRRWFCQRYGHNWSTFPCQHGSLVIVCGRCGKEKGCAEHRLG